MCAMLQLFFSLLFVAIPQCYPMLFVMMGPLTGGGIGFAPIFVFLTLLLPRDAHVLNTAQQIVNPALRILITVASAESRGYQYFEEAVSAGTHTLF